jgi:hypothetical protein
MQLEKFGAADLEGYMVLWSCRRSSSVAPDSDDPLGMSIAGRTQVS